MDTGVPVDPSPLISSQERRDGGDGFGGDNSTQQTEDDMTSESFSETGQELIRSQQQDSNNKLADATNDNNEDDGHHTLAPPSWHDTLFHPFSSTKQFFTDLASFFSWRFLSWMAIQQCFISGGVFSLVMALGLPLFKQLGIDASRQQLYMTLIMSPWAMKPFIGVASDLFPIRGYNKRYFAVYSILIGLVGCSVLLGLYHSGSAEAAINAGPDSVQSFADWIVICFTAVSYEAATLDILGEGKYSELMRIYPESGSSIISFKFGWSLLGTIITQSFVGPLSDAGYFHVLFWIALMMSLTPFYSTLMGWIPEKKRNKDEPGMTKLCAGCLFDKRSFQEKKTPFLIITACGLAAPIMAAVTTYSSLRVGLAVSAVLLIGFTVATYFIFPRTFFLVFLSIVLTYCSSISISSGLSYFYTADEKCLPDGPHFDYTYYITITGIVGSVVNFFGVIIYQYFLSGWRFRPGECYFEVLLSCFALIYAILPFSSYYADSTYLHHHYWGHRSLG